MEEQWIELQRTVLDCPDTGQSTGLATLGMGLKPAVAITLHLHRNLLRWEAASGLRQIRSSAEVERRLWEQDFQPPRASEATEAGAQRGSTPATERPGTQSGPSGLDPALEVRRDRPTPFTAASRSAWLLFIDDLRTHRIVEDEDARWLVGSVDRLLEAALERYSEAGWPGETLAESALEVTALGERIHGGVGRRDLPAGFLGRLPEMVLFSAGERALNFHEKSVVQGRLV